MHGQLGNFRGVTNVPVHGSLTLAKFLHFLKIPLSKAGLYIITHVARVHRRGQESSWEVHIIINNYFSHCLDRSIPKLGGLEVCSAMNL